MKHSINRKVKKVLIVLLMFIVIAVGNIPVYAIEEIQNKRGGEKLKLSLIEDQELQKEATANAVISISDEEEQALDDNNALMKAVVTKDKNVKNKYADYFAGTYINDDESLVVQFTKDAKKSEINECMENVSDSADVEIVKHSYDDIEAQYEKDSALMAELSKAVKNGTATVLEKSVSNNLISIALSQKDNCNIITLKEVTEKTKNDFITCFDDKNVTFKESKSDTIKKCKTTVKPGSSFAIYGEENGEGYYYYGRSVGPRMSYDKANGDRIYGFLTAAHCVDKIGQLVYYKKDGKYVKYGKVSTYKNSGCADAAFVKQTNTTDFTTSKYTAYSNSKGKTTKNIKLAKIVHMRT